jgi:hypothetical protein
MWNRARETDLSLFSRDYHLVRMPKSTRLAPSHHLLVGSLDSAQALSLVAGVALTWGINMTRAKAGTVAGHLQDMTLTVKTHRPFLLIDPLCMHLQGNVSLATRKQAPPPLPLDLIHAPPPSRQQSARPSGHAWFAPAPSWQWPSTPSGNSWITPTWLTG